MSDKQNDELTDTTHPLYDETKDPTHPFYEGDRTDAEPSPNEVSQPADLNANARLIVIAAIGHMAWVCRYKGVGEKPCSTQL